MTLKEWMDGVLLADGSFDGCYVAITRGDAGYDLEVEVDNGVIGSTYQGIPSVGKASELVRELEFALQGRGITVYRSREAWEASWEE